MIKVGDKIPTWFSGSPDGLSTVLEVKPYNGYYGNLFNCVLKLTAENCRSRSIEMSYWSEPC